MLKGGVKYEISQIWSSTSSSDPSLPYQSRRYKIMICRYPVELDRLIDGRHHIIYVPCGKCAWCLRQKRNEWFVRFFEESKRNLFTRFVTLDYDDDHLPYKVDENGEAFPSVYLRDIQLYHKSLRNDYKFRFFLVSEYGKRFCRPHYHAIYWSNEKIPFLDYWKNGTHGADLPANPGSFKYVTKYILKGSGNPPGSEPNFHIMSRRPGIGVGFMENYNEFTPFYRYFNSKMKMPGYYNRKFETSLSNELRDSLSQSKIDYLSTQGKYENFYNDFSNYAPKDISIDEWIDRLYSRDVRKQFQINQKS